MKKTIFISGIAGFLGSHIADAMLAEGHRVIGCDNLIGGYLDNVPKEAEFYEKDILDFDSMKKLTKNIDVIYHTAALAYEGLSVFSPYLISKNIFSGTASLLSAFISNGNTGKLFIYCSSMARYGDNKVPFTEDMTLYPKDPYGIAKAASEDIIRELCRVHGIKYIICVPHNIIGPRQKYDDPYRNVASIMINLMLQGRQPIIYGDGFQKRCFSFIQDDIQIFRKLAYREDLTWETINIGPDEEFVTINELAETIADLLEFDLNPIYMSERPSEVYYATCSAKKIRELFNYKTNYTLRQGLTEMINYIKKKGAKPFVYHLDLEIISDITPETWKNKLF